MTQKMCRGVKMQKKQMYKLGITIFVGICALASVFCALWFLVISPTQERSIHAATQFTGSSTLTSVITSAYSKTVTNPYTSTYSSAYQWVYTSGYIVPTNQGVASSYSAFAITYTAGKAHEVEISYKCSSESSSYDYLMVLVNGSTASGWSNKGGSMSDYETATISISTTSQVVLQFVYRKDGSVDSNDDCVYINSIKIKAGTFSGSTTLTSVISSSYSVSVTNPYTSTYSSAYKWVYTSGYIVPTNQSVASSYSAFALTYTAGALHEVEISYKCSSESSSYDYLTVLVNGSTPSGWTNKERRLGG